MRLTDADLRFVKALVPEQADRVLDILSRRSDVLVAMGAAAKPRTVLQDLADYLVLAARVVRGLLRTSGASKDAGVYVERAPAAAAARGRYVERFRPGTPYVAVSSSTSMVCPAGTRRAAAKAMGVLLRSIVAADRSVVSELTSSYVDIVKSCVLVAGHAYASRGREALLFRPYRLEVPFVSAYLMAQGMRAVPIVGTTPMAAHVGTLVGSSAMLCTAYQIDEFAHFHPLDGGGTWELWGPTELVEMEQQYGDAPAPDMTDVIGVYTQGFWLRVLQGSIDEAAARPHVELERRFLDLVERFARAHPRVRLVLFPHPQERARHARTGEHGYGELLGLPNVELDTGDESSIFGFDSVGLGITTVSTVGFDRLHIGRRTVFLVGDNDFIDLSVPSRYNSVFHTDADEFLGHVEAARLQPHEQFMAEHFGDAYDGLWGPWRTGDTTAGSDGTSGDTEAPVGGGT